MLTKQVIVTHVIFYISVESVASLAALVYAPQTVRQTDG